jgi:hypothetical protein
MVEPAAPGARSHLDASNREVSTHKHRPRCADICDELAIRELGAADRRISAPVDGRSSWVQHIVAPAEESVTST